MKLPIHNLAGEVVGQADAADAVFGVEVKPDLLHQALVRMQANQRQGTSNTLTRAQVSSTGRKPFAQKGTGRARQGGNSPPHHRHGGRAFGPHPRSYRQDMPKRMRRNALKSALSGKVQAEQIRVVQDLDTLDSKTKSMAGVLSALGVKGSTLVVTRDGLEAVQKGVRNLPRTKVLRADLLNVLDLARYGTLVITPEAVARAGELWADDRRIRKTEEAAA